MPAQPTPREKNNLIAALAPTDEERAWEVIKSATSLPFVPPDQAKEFYQIFQGKPKLSGFAMERIKEIIEGKSAVPLATAGVLGDTVKPLVNKSIGQDLGRGNTRGEIISGKAQTAEEMEKEKLSQGRSGALKDFFRKFFAEEEEKAKEKK